MLRDLTKVQTGQQLGCRGRALRLSISARHPSKATQHRQTGPGAKKTAKKRDISTSFRRGPVPRPLVNHTSTGSQQPEDEDDLSSSVIIGIPPPAATSSSAALLKSATTNPAVSQAQAAASADLSLLGEPCRIGAGGSGSSSSRASSGGGEPVIALAATAPVLTAQDLGLLSLVVDDSPVSTTDSDADSADVLWAAEADDPLASFDRVLDGLLVAPVPQPAAFTTSSKPPSSSSPSTNSLTLSSLLAEQPFVASSTPAAGQAPQPDSAAAGERRSKSGKAARLAAAAAAPAVTVVHCETEFERELQAAAALQQLLVVKFESSQHLLQGGSDSSLRFQTHTNRPTQLNTYMPHSDISPGFGFYAGGNSGNSSSNGPSSSTVDVLASMGINLGTPSSSSSTGAGSMGVSGSLFGSPSPNSGEPFSPVHAWYKQLAAQYAHSAAAAGQPSPVRFLSVQCDGARARAVARRLGVSAPLAVALVDAASGRKLQEVIGAKIQTELPNGLLYFGGSDPQGLNPTEQLAQLNTEADLEALKSSSQLSVAAFHVHGAPPCVRSYARMYAVAQQYAAASPAVQPSAAGTPSDGASPRVAFGVMDVDAVAAEGGAVSSKLGLQQLPAYIVYKDGQEVARLSSSPDRRRLAEVLAQQVAAMADAAAGSQQ